MMLNLNSSKPEILNIYERILDFIGEERMVNTRLEHPRVGIALSGGADSVALLIMALQMQWNVRTYHCNFHLRGEESDRDTTFVEDLCNRLNVPLHIKHFDIFAMQKQPDHKGESIEMLCRDARYKWFESIAKEHRLEAFALGHHADDNVETALLNAFRGCGLKGVKGMPPKRGIFIRPLLCISKKEVLAIVDAADTPYINDSTNFHNEFSRNRIRNIIIPEIEQNFPGASERMARTVANLRSDCNLLKLLVQEKCDKYLTGNGEIRATEMFEKETSAIDLLYHFLDGRLEKKQIESLRNNLDNSGKIYHLSDGSHLLLDRGILKPTDNLRPHDSEIELDKLIAPLRNGSQRCNVASIPEFGLTLTAKLIAQEDFHPRRDPRYAWFPASAFNSEALTIRGPRNGDRMQPFGMNGTRLLSDIFTDAKLSLAEKQRQGVVVIPSTGEIIWLPGLKNSALYPVGNSDTDIFEFHIEYFK